MLRVLGKRLRQHHSDTRGDGRLPYGPYTHTVGTMQMIPNYPLCCSLRTHLSFAMSGEQFEEMRIRRLVLIPNLPFPLSLWEMTNFLCSRLSIPKMRMTRTAAFVPMIIRINKMMDVEMPFN